MEEEDFEFLDDTSRAFLQEPMKSSSYLLWTILSFFVIMFIWAYFAKLDERTVAQGTVIPSSKVQNIQNLEGGIVAEIYVKEGMVVDKDQILLKIDPTQFTSSYDENLVKYYSLLVKLQRLEAENLDKETVVFSPILQQKYSDFVQNETNLFKANRENHAASIRLLSERYENLLEQYQLANPLAKEGIISQLELLKIEKDLYDAKNNIAVEQKTYKSEINEKIVSVKSEMDALKKILDGLSDRIARTTIKSPLKGIVKKLDFHTIGGVVKPGEKIMEIVPFEDTLFIEVKIPPEKIAFIHPGQSADIKITAYDYSIYGSLTGLVTYISADSIIEQDELGKKVSFFKANIKTEQNFLEFRGDKLPIIPGMEVSASILTGEKTVLEYILKPLIKVKESALQEK